MATELLTYGNTATTSADFTVPASGERIVYLKGGGQVRLQLKDGTSYFTVDTLHVNKPAIVLKGGAEIMTYRLLREAGENAGATVV